MKKAIALAMASVMAAGLLAGCGGSAANSTAASSEAASSEAASTSTEAATEAHTVNTTDPITLTISWWGGDARQAAYEAACKAFTEKYPNITVECTYGPWNGWEEAQSTALAAGTAADVMQVNWNWLFQYSGKGQSFVNLNDYSDVLDLTQFPSSALDACTVANSLQAVPVAMAGRIYYWNMATFKKAGLDHYPTTEQELLDAAKTFQEKLGDDYYPLAAGPLDRMIMMTFYLESKYGEPWVTDSTLNYTVEQLQEGLEWIQSLEDNHVMPDLKTMNAAGDKTITDGQAWITGKYAGIFEWDSAPSKYQSALADNSGFTVGEEIKFGDKANGGFSKVSMGMAITKTCKNPAEAATLIEYLWNGEGAAIMGSECGVPASKAGLATAQAAGKINELVAEANGKVMSFVSCQLDPLFESSDLKATGTGIYQEVFDTVDYDNKSGADVVDTLLDGMSAVGYTV